MALRSRNFFSVLLLAACCAAVSSSAAAQQQSAPVVQPGAPGQPSRTLTGDDARASMPVPAVPDIDFMQGMIMHHNQAVLMTSLIPSHHASEDVTAIGAKISSSQTQEMEFMKQWLTVRHQSTDMSMPGMPDMDMHGNAMPSMPGMLTPRQMDALTKASGPEFDHLFLTGMIQHHTGALTMVDQLFKKPGAGQDADLFNFATDVDNTQRAEIRIMESMLHKTEPDKSKEKQ